MRSRVVMVAVIWSLLLTGTSGRAAGEAPGSVLADHLLVAWYGNPHSTQMGVLGQYAGPDRAAGLVRQGAAYAAVTHKQVLLAYEVVAVVAQCAPGADGKYRLRELAEVIRALHDEARSYGISLVLDVQVGRSTVAEEIAALEPFLSERDVYLALDPEFAMDDCGVPGESIGALRASDVNRTLDTLECLIADEHLPPKVLILHQFRTDMLPDRVAIRRSATVDVVIDMDGFGPPALKLSSYRDVMRSLPVPFAGIKLFCRQDPNLMTPAAVMGLAPTPSVVIYQ